LNCLVHNRLRCKRRWHPFQKSSTFIKPENDWEKFGCEDPRVSKINRQVLYFLHCIVNVSILRALYQVGVAITRDFKKIQEKHLVTPFNSKAMSLFPEKVDGRYAVVLSVIQTARPGLRWHILTERNNVSPTYWEGWYSLLDDNIIPLERSPKDILSRGTAN